jgi:hypothetical protein
MDDFIIVSTSEDGEVTELDLEDTGELALSTLQSQFGPSIIGLKYRNPKTGNFRGVTVKEEKLIPPTGGWTDRLYVVTSRAVGIALGEARGIETTSSQGDSEKGKLYPPERYPLILLKSLCTYYLIILNS